MFELNGYSCPLDIDYVKGITVKKIKINSNWNDNNFYFVFIQWLQYKKINLLDKIIINQKIKNKLFNSNKFKIYYPINKKYLFNKFIIYKFKFILIIEIS